MYTPSTFNVNSNTTPWIQANHYVRDEGKPKQFPSSCL